MSTAQKIKEEWIPVITKLRDLLEAEDLFDREKIAILLILVGNYLNSNHIIRKEAFKLLGWAMSTYHANIPITKIGYEVEHAGIYGYPKRKD